MHWRGSWSNHFISWGDGEHPSPQSTMAPTEFPARYVQLRIELVYAAAVAEDRGIAYSRSNAFVTQSFMTNWRVWRPGPDRVSPGVTLQHAVTGSSAATRPRRLWRSQFSAERTIGVLKLVAEK